MKRGRSRRQPIGLLPYQWILDGRPADVPGAHVAALPWPPSVNTYWRSPPKLGRTILSAKARDYREHAGVLLMSQRLSGLQLEGRLGIVVVAYPPDRRSRDLDNLWKPILDVLTHAGTIADDEQFDSLAIERGDVLAPWGLIQIQLQVRKGCDGTRGTGDSAGARGVREPSPSIAAARGGGATTAQGAQAENGAGGASGGKRRGVG